MNCLAFRRARLQYIYSILRGKDLETGQFSEERRDQQFEKLKVAQTHTLDLTNWHEFLKSLKQAGYSNESFISSNNNILYAYVLFLIGRVDYKVDLYELRRLSERESEILNGRRSQVFGLEMSSSMAGLLGV